ncbi:hypothetical protein L798_09728 [Zootermopsis nevadensis]|uniref:Uncharacterized protein n=1 Tax=Zootermopsis nevadensis TaxID=136037 RepID=A0A067QYR1_ZOONE|nr:hypothetical protein L798_09728 [Zootermopsis nevadensis]
MSARDRVNIQQCLLNAGCEGYTNYEEYGLVALPFRYIFRSTASRNVSQRWENHKCNTRFQCPFNVLRLLRYITRLIFKFFKLT